ncbi:MAG: tagaturonate epimerase family protein [Sedimentisphaerales bacterium]
MRLGRYSFGVGDRFGLEGRAQLWAIMQAKKRGIDVTPVWNKSYREHTIIGSGPASVRAEADDAVKSLGFEASYFVDADHVGLDNVDLFVDSSDFFTLDVADFIGREVSEDKLNGFADKYGKYIPSVEIPQIKEPIEVTKEQLLQVGRKFLAAVEQAGHIYRHIKSRKGIDIVIEVSMDETDTPQTPAELLFILAMIADEGIPAQTIAPRFTGRFNKGVDYAGDVLQFARDFEESIAVVKFAAGEFGLSSGLKLSVHSGSDKFAIYEPISEALKKFDAGVHIKTAGTTWLEEIAALAEAGSDGLRIAKDIYNRAYEQMDGLCKPYATVIDIKKERLPSPQAVNGWSSEQYSEALRHNTDCDGYNPDFRQLMHVAYKVAAQMKERYIGAVKENERIVSKAVQGNIYRHLEAVFMNGI